MRTASGPPASERISVNDRALMPMNASRPTAPLPGALLDPIVNNAYTSSMLLGIMLHDGVGPTMIDCTVVQIRNEPHQRVDVSSYNVHFISSIVTLDVRS